MRILAVDDSPTLREVLVTTLRDGGHHVTVAANGAEAAETLKADSFDLIISDLNMVVMGGFELLSEVRESPRHMATPFIFLTTETDAELKSMARAYGATAWMVKPFHPGALHALVGRFAME